MKKRSFTIYRRIKISPEAFFDAISDPRKIKKWSGQKGTIRLRDGGKMSLFDGWVTGQVVEFVPDSRLVYSWKPADWDEEIESLVEISIFPDVSSLRIKLKHSGFPDDKSMLNHRSGWNEFFFNPLKNYFTGSE